MRASFKDAALQRDLEESGFARVSLWPRHEVQSLLDRLTAEVGSAWGRHSALGGRDYTFHSTTLDDDLDYRRRAFEIVKEAAAPAIQRLLERYTVVTAGVVVKESGSGPLTLHPDPTLTRNVDDVSLTIWCPLVDTDAANGGLCVVPGSHRVARHITGSAIEGYHWSYVEALAPFAVPLSLAAGEAAIFDSRLLHGSPPNGSDRIRPAVMIACVPDEAEPVLYTADPGGSGRLLMFDHSNARYLNYPAADFFSGRVAEELIGSIANPNRPLPFAEFERRLVGGKRPPGGLLARLADMKRRVFTR
ncbi:MAG TPA: phytanoyl-CoA dioxygenase family protein [Allosphingosinicella sp.]